MTSITLILTECTRDDILDIALCNFDWKTVGRRLLESEKNITDILIDEQSEQNKKEAVLIMWQRQKGSSATYRVLAETFQKLNYGNTEEKVKEMWSKRSNDGGSVHSTD